MINSPKYQITVQANTPNNKKKLPTRKQQALWVFLRQFLSESFPIWEVATSYSKKGEGVSLWFPGEDPDLPTACDHHCWGWG